MRRARNVFIRFSNEPNFVKALSREATDVDGVPYRGFHWHPDFDEEAEPSLVLVWVFLLGLPPNFYHESLLKNITSPFGRFLRRDNATRCATKTDGARVCLEMDAAVEPIRGIWIGMPNHSSSLYVNIECETLPAYCSICRVQGHNLQKCKRKEGAKSVGVKKGKEREENKKTCQLQNLTNGEEESKETEHLP
ncbi:uncharacterized protein LOC122306492 [Carya illinoinensis]|uniref:uncharacterized protein LOC122306492 n=1 Tax=Carya illinoinensis TaxID=32201 RepID=UPI001C71E9F1|nr:uncharacterized protein LOC122306492 [Carya illinoinensis]